MNVSTGARSLVKSSPVQCSILRLTLLQSCWYLQFHMSIVHPTDEERQVLRRPGRLSSI